MIEKGLSRFWHGLMDQLREMNSEILIAIEGGVSHPAPPFVASSMRAFKAVTSTCGPLAPKL